MADKTDAWMPLWIGAYLADTMKLTTVQHGAYFLLLISYWRERAPLVDDDEELRSITKTDRSEWKRLRPVMSKFFRVGDGVWWHKRVEAEIAAADERSKKSSEKAKKAAEARWGDKDKHAPSNAPSIPQALPEDVPDVCPTPSPSSTFHSEEKKAPPRKRDSAPDVPRPDDVAEQVWNDWVQLRKGKRAAVSLTAVDGAREEAAKAGIGLEAFLRIWCRRGSQGLEADWIKPHERNQSAPQGKYAAASAGIFGGNQQPQRGEVIDV